MPIPVTASFDSSFEAVVCGRTGASAGSSPTAGMASLQQSHVPYPDGSAGPKELS